MSSTERTINELAQVLNEYPTYEIIAAVQTELDRRAKNIDGWDHPTAVKNLHILEQLNEHVEAARKTWLTS